MLDIYTRYANENGVDDGGVTTMNVIATIFNLYTVGICIY